MSLRSTLASAEPTIAPGVYDALTASIAAEAGFKALYLTGAGIAYTKLGRPDIGLVSMMEVADTIAMIRDRVDTPLVVDGDTGFGNALNVQRTIRLFERMGASAIQLEDQTTPKRCGHLTDKAVISASEMVGKIKAALDARQSSETLIVARTDALAIEGMEAAIERAERYAEAGADVLFVEAPKSSEQLSAIAGRLASKRPLLANMVEGGSTPIHAASELGALGFKLVIFPGGIVRALAFSARAYYQSLAQAGSTKPFADRMLDFAGLNAMLGTADILANGARYAADDEGTRA